MKQQLSLLGVVLLVLTAIVLSGCAPGAKHAARKNAAAAAAPVQGTPVSVMTLQPSDLNEVVEVTGTLEPADEVTVGTRAEGRIAWIIGKEGTSVYHGEAVARLEDRDAQTQLRSTRAAYQAAKAHLEQATAASAQQVSDTDSGIQNAHAALDGAIARLKQSETTAGATKATAEAQVKSARATLEAAKARLSELQNGSRAQEKAIAESAVRLAQANYDSDRKNYRALSKAL